LATVACRLASLGDLGDISSAPPVTGEPSATLSRRAINTSALPLPCHCRFSAPLGAALRAESALDVRYPRTRKDVITAPVRLAIRRSGVGLVDPAQFPRSKSRPYGPLAARSSAGTRSTGSLSVRDADAGRPLWSCAAAPTSARPSARCLRGKAPDTWPSDAPRVPAAGRASLASHTFRRWRCLQ
jgi:hypothetical protein